MFCFLNIFYIFILLGFDFRLQGSKLRFQRKVPVIGTSVVVYVPLLEFMYLCCGLRTSVVVYVPLVGLRGFRGWTKCSDTKKRSKGERGGVGWGWGRCSQLSLAVLDDPPVFQFMCRREDGLRGPHVLNDGRLAAVRLAHR